VPGLKQAIAAEDALTYFGLSQALDAQGEGEEAKRVKEEFETVWQYSDITIARSIY
jgi:hypothetical protein